MLTLDMHLNIQGYYEAYRMTFINDVKESDGYGKGIESVCNHKEMVAIINAIPKQVLDDGQWVDWVLNKMRERVGQPGTTKKIATDKWPTFGELPSNA